jgi:hypothetical protein
MLITKANNTQIKLLLFTWNSPNGLSRVGEPRDATPSPEAAQDGVEVGRGHPAEWRRQHGAAHRAADDGSAGGRRAYGEALAALEYRIIEAVDVVQTLSAPGSL